MWRENQRFILRAQEGERKRILKLAVYRSKREETMMTVFSFGNMADCGTIIKLEIKYSRFKRNESSCLWDGQQKYPTSLVNCTHETLWLK